MGGGGEDRRFQRGGPVLSPAFGHHVGGHEAVARARHAGDGDGGRGLCQHLGPASGAGGGAGAVRHQHAGRAPGDHGLRGLGGIGAGMARQRLGLGAVEIQRDMVQPQQGGEALGLAGAGRNHAQVGLAQGRVGGDGFQLRHGQVAVDHHRAAPGRFGRAEGAVAQGRQHPVARGFQRMGVGHGGDQAVGILDRHVDVGRPFRQPLHPVGGDPQGAHGGQQRVTLGVGADRAQHGNGLFPRGQGNGHVQRDAAGHVADAARHVGARRHRRGTAADHVPQHRADAEDVRARGCHPTIRSIRCFFLPRLTFMPSPISSAVSIR